MLTNITTHARKLALAAVIATGALAVNVAVANDWNAKDAKPLAAYQETEVKEMIEAINSVQPRTAAAPSVAAKDYSTLPEDQVHELLDAINRDYPMSSARSVQSTPNFAASANRTASDS